MKNVYFAIALLILAFPLISRSANADKIMVAAESANKVPQTGSSTKSAGHYSPELDYSLAINALSENTKAGDRKAFSHLYAASIHGHGRSMVLLGRFFLVGKGTQESFEDGISWLRKAAAIGEVDANFYLAFAKWMMSGYGGDASEIPNLTINVLRSRGHEESLHYVGSAFLLGDAWKRSIDSELKKFSDSAFLIVLRSKINHELIESFKKEILQFGESGLTGITKGDGSRADLACQKVGFKVWDDGYINCKSQTQQAISLQEQQQAQYEEQIRRYRQAVADYEQRRKDAEEERRQQRGMAMLQYGLSIMSGTSPRALDNFERASREVLRLPPAPEPPKFESFSVVGPSGQRTMCTLSASLVSCR